MSEPVGYYCNHSDEPRGERTHEGWEWTDDDAVWQRQPDVISSNSGVETLDGRHCPRAVPVYAAPDIETAVHDMFATADERGVMLDAHTPDELTRMVMHAIRGGRS